MISQTDINVWPGIVMSVIGTNPGPASGITYEVAVFTDTGTLNIEMEPVGSRFPDELQTVAAPEGTPVIVQQVVGEFMLMPPGESFEIEVCEEPSP